MPATDPIPEISMGKTRFRTPPPLAILLKPLHEVNTQKYSNHRGNKNATWLK
jgi:hypothetical protein